MSGLTEAAQRFPSMLETEPPIIAAGNFGYRINCSVCNYRSERVYQGHGAVDAAERHDRTKRHGENSRREAEALDALSGSGSVGGDR